ncbi:MAG: DUF4920 domain-containing protein [Myxococcota bacterium]
MTPALWLAVACGAPAPAPVEGAVDAAPAAEVAAQPAPAAAPAAASVRDGWKTFGGAFSVAEAVPASTVLADPAAHAAAPVRMTGELTEVCQAKGCWAVVRDDAGHSIRITMKDHAFGIDKDTAGRSCDVQGQLVSKPVDPAQLEHFASEGSNQPPPEAGKTEAWQLVADAVAIAPS